MKSTLLFFHFQCPWQSCCSKERNQLVLWKALLWSVILFFVSVKLILPVQNLSLTFSRLRYSETDTRQLIGEQLCYFRSLTSP